MAETIDALQASLDRLVAVPDPAERLRLLAEFDREIVGFSEVVRAVKRDTIDELRRVDPLATWQRIGEIVGLTPQRVSQLSRT